MRHLVLVDKAGVTHRWVEILAEAPPDGKNFIAVCTTDHIASFDELKKAANYTRDALRDQLLTCLTCISEDGAWSRLAAEMGIDPDEQDPEVVGAALRKHFGWSL